MSKILVVLIYVASVFRVGGVALAESPDVLVSDLAWHPSGEFIAVANEFHGRTRLVRRDGSALGEVKGFALGTTRVQFSQDGHYLYTFGIDVDDFTVGPEGATKRLFPVAEDAGELPPPAHRMRVFSTSDWVEVVTVETGPVVRTTSLGQHGVAYKVAGGALYTHHADAPHSRFEAIFPASNLISIHGVPGTESLVVVINCLACRPGQTYEIRRLDGGMTVWSIPLDVAFVEAVAADRLLPLLFLQVHDRERAWVTTSYDLELGRIDGVLPMTNAASKARLLASIDGAVGLLLTNFKKTHVVAAPNAVSSLGTATTTTTTPVAFAESNPQWTNIIAVGHTPGWGHDTGYSILALD